MHKLCQQVAYFWNCTGVFYGTYVYGCPLRVSKIHPFRRIDGTYGPDVRAQKNDARTYGRSLRPVRTGSVYRP